METLARSASAALDQLRRPVSWDGGTYPKTRGRSALRWFIDTLALAAGGMARVYAAFPITKTSSALSVTLPSISTFNVGRDLVSRRTFRIFPEEACQTRRAARARDRGFSIENSPAPEPNSRDKALSCHLVSRIPVTLSAVRREPRAPNRAVT